MLHIDVPTEAHRWSIMAAAVEEQQEATTEESDEEEEVEEEEEEEGEEEGETRKFLAEAKGEREQGCRKK